MYSIQLALPRHTYTANLCVKQKKHTRSCQASEAGGTAWTHDKEAKQRSCLKPLPMKKIANSS